MDLGRVLLDENGREIQTVDHRTERGHVRIERLTYPAKHIVELRLIQKSDS